MNQKSAIALALSFFLPRIGLVYLGDTQKGIGLFVSSIICNLISIYSFSLAFWYLSFGHMGCMPHIFEVNNV